MLIYLTFLLLIINILKTNQIDSNNSYLTINDKFSYMQCIEDNKTFIIYLGNELIYFNIKESKNIKFNNEYISFSFVNKAKNIILTFPINNTRIFYNTNDEFTLLNENNIANFYIKINEDIRIQTEEYNISLKNTSKYFYLLSADNEFIFVNYCEISHILIFLGLFIILYGSHHFLLGLIVHIFIFSFIFIGDIISFFNYFHGYNKKIILYLLFFCLLLSISLVIFLNTNKENIYKIKIINFLYGFFFGFSCFKTIIYYYIFFEFPIDFVEKKIRILLYFISLIIFISFGGFINFLDLFHKYRYLPCSAVSGSFYIIKGLAYIIGGYFSSILFIKENLSFINLKNEILYYSLTYFFIQIILIVFSILFQIKYIKFKEIEEPESYMTKENILLSKITNLSISNTKLTKDDEEVVKNKMIDKSVTNEKDEEEEEIIEQEDQN